MKHRNKYRLKHEVDREEKIAMYGSLAVGLIALLMIIRGML